MPEECWRAAVSGGRWVGDRHTPFFHDACNGLDDGYFVLARIFVWPGGGGTLTLWPICLP